MAPLLDSWRILIGALDNYNLNNKFSMSAMKKHKKRVVIERSKRQYEKP